MAKKNATNQNIKTTSICMVLSSSPEAQFGESASIRLADFIQLVEPLVEKIFIITSRKENQNALWARKVHFVGDVACPRAGAPIIAAIVGELRAQIQITRNLISIAGNVDITLWRGRSSTFLLPLLVSRLKGKKSVVFIEGKHFELVNQVYRGPLGITGFLFSQIYRLIEKASHSLSNKLVVDFPSLLNEPWLAKYKGKVFPFSTPIRFVNNNFRISRPLSQRQPIVGYIGRMHSEKGVLNFVKAISSIRNQMGEIKFLLGGEGPLLEQVRTELAELVYQKRAEIAGWIPHDELPEYLNRMRLLVLPSDYEGLGVITLEAMACGTPVLAPPVGGVVDVVIDGETGFIMKDNSPDCISRNVIRAMKHPSLDRISQNAHEFVKKGYTFKAVQERWSKLIVSLESE